MGEVFEFARSFGLGGLGLLATVLSIRLAVQAIDLARAQQKRRNGNGNGNGTKISLDDLRLICPLCPGNHSLDDVHEVLVEIRGGMERLNETQKEIVVDTKERSHRLNDVLNALRLELARRDG